MATVSEDFDFIMRSIGDYIRFEWNGIIDGLKGRGCKYDYCKIIGQSEAGLRVRIYRKKGFQILPHHRMNQKYDIINKKQFILLPVF
jgi:hypothetical protein